MNISFKEIVLKRLCVEDIELLRQWRNSSFIAENMFFQEEISQVQQVVWFENLHPENDFYFIIEYKQESIGLVNLKEINWTLKQAESGLFVALEHYRNTPLAIYASLALLNFAFIDKKLEVVKASVKKNNLHTIQYNQSLGFEKVKEDEYQLTKERYNMTSKILYNKLK
jgi:RimJ/RimL family protein N-acetyltransferase